VTIFEFIRSKIADNGSKFGKFFFRERFFLSSQFLGSCINRQVQSDLSSNEFCTEIPVVFGPPTISLTRFMKKFIRRTPRAKSFFLINFTHVEKISFRRAAQYFHGDLQRNYSRTKTRERNGRETKKEYKNKKKEYKRRYICLRRDCVCSREKLSGYLTFIRHRGFLTSAQKYSGVMHLCSFLPSFRILSSSSLS